MSNPNVLERFLEDLRRRKFVFVRLLVLGIILLVMYNHPLDTLIKGVFTPIVGQTGADYLYLFMLIPVVLLVAYFVIRIYLDLSSFIIDAALSRVKLRSATSTVLILNKILSLILLVTFVTWILSSHFPFLAGYAQAIVTSFSGLFSLLITLILAMQMREVGGNFLAGILLRTSDVVSEGDYIKMDTEYVRVEKIDHTYTYVVNVLDERIFIPNLKFLTDQFRKPYSKQSREFVDLRFDLSYEYSQEQVERDMSDLVDQFNQSQNRSVKIDEFRVVAVNLAAYSVTYELRVRPSAPIFPETIRSDFRRLLHEKYGRDLATPMLLNVRK